MTDMLKEIVEAMIDSIVTYQIIPIFTYFNSQSPQDCTSSSLSGGLLVSGKFICCQLHRVYSITGDSWYLLKFYDIKQTEHSL